jgi:DNA-binding transcriptional ArsR family regulator
MGPIEREILRLLAASPDGLPEPVLRAHLSVPISQPTLHRYLATLRTRGLVIKLGAARATRYRYVGGRHHLAELRSRALHERIAQRLASDPRRLKLARRRLEELRAANPAASRHHDAWARLLEGDLHALLLKMTEDTEEARALRKESPFGRLLPAAERTKILRQFATPDVTP